LPAPVATTHTGGVPNATPTTAPTAVARASFTVPAETVWAYRLDFANLSGYNPDVTDVTRVADGTGDAAGGVHGPGARYTFSLADPRRPGKPQPIELWIVEAVSPTLVTAAMSGGSDAYEEFVVERRDDGGCEATLTLWVTLPDGLSDEVRTAAAAGSLASISMELRLMQEVLQGDTPAATS
jgi:Polyketide cyclase / dehydrase and lipid transport